MTTKKQARANEKRRREQLERKHALRAEAQRRRKRQALWALAAIGGVIAVVTLGWYGTTHWWGADATPEAAPSSTDSVGDPLLPTADPLPVEGWGGSSTPPPASLAEGRMWTATIETNQGTVVVELDGVAAPQATASFIALAGDGFFDNTECHRLVTSGIFVLQCGDPLGTGSGGPAYRFGPVENAPADNIYPVGTLAMARVGGDGNSMGSQFFIVYSDSAIPPDNAGGYTVFGTVTQGLDIVEAVAAAGTITGDADGRPALSMILTEVTAS
jgi:peptidyl-prolyl cis-trans isomerase B (cyclophilin B)